jgi:hypothetical protein
MQINRLAVFQTEFNPFKNEKKVISRIRVTLNNIVIKRTTLVDYTNSAAINLLKARLPSAMSAKKNKWRRVAAE